MLKTIVFDMGNVLVHFSHEQMCRQIGAVCSRPWEEVWQWLFDEGWEIAFERGDIDAAEFHRRIELRSGRSVERSALVAAASDIFTLNEPMVPLLKQLREQGHRLVLLSNTHEWHIDFVRRLFNVLQEFDAFVLSYEVRAVKPEPAIFERLVNELQCAPSEAFYTDDIEKYVELGRSFGLEAEVFTTPVNLARHLAEREVCVRMDDEAAGSWHE